MNYSVKFCSNCGHELKDGEKYCSECGKPINPEQQIDQSMIKKCVYCNNVLTEDFLFCPKCGKTLTSENQNGQISQSTDHETHPHEKIFPNDAKLQDGKTTKKKKHSKLKAFLFIITTIILVISVCYIIDYPQGLKFEAMSRLGFDDTDQKVTMDLPKLKSDISSIESAFKNKDLNKIKNFLHPQIRSNYMEAFEKHKNELDRVAKLIATRVPVVEGFSYAEYEVTENGKKYTMVFQKIKDQWYLTQF